MDSIGVYVEPLDNYLVVAEVIDDITISVAMDDEVIIAAIDYPLELTVISEEIEAVSEVATAAQQTATAAAATASAAQQTATAAQQSAGNIITNFNSWVRATLLTGIGAFTNFSIAATDTILSAFAKLQGQINAFATRITSLENKLIYEETILNDITAVSYTLTGFSIPPNKTFKIYWDAPANGGSAGNYFLVQLNLDTRSIYQRAITLGNGWIMQQGYTHTRSQISMTLLDGDILGGDLAIWNNSGSYSRTLDALGTYRAGWDVITSITLLRTNTPKIPAGTKIKIFYE